ncbi:hypothetical protein CPB86DRAFT_771649 [Serendipita vermifera]|nr:hypothetical protein CPB86DRAFT_771649 [Serendipita vermifera]
MSISHVGIRVDPAKFDSMVDWYLKVLAPIGYKNKFDLRPENPVVGLGATYPDFWISPCEDALLPRNDTGFHLAFYATDRQKIRDFHEIALKLGAKCNGPPGLRPQYMPTYYAAFVIDPEGRNIEIHSMRPGIIAEAKSKSIVIATLGVLIAVGLAYFTNLGVYASSFI